MPTPTPEATVAAQLASVLGSPWVVGTNVFAGEEVPGETAGVPFAALFCAAYGGEAPMPYLGGPSASSFFKPRVQVLVRGDPNTRTATLLVARRAAAALNKAALSGYVACQLQQADPVSLGRDVNGCSRFSVNVELWLDAHDVPNGT